ncbi:HAD family hydrolase [Leifsonia xyli subsp. xyli]|uniref:Phosphonoacetaldehyde hydrolase n=2 Tax=Leifsonia xyli subsp. xyli TaxID=59736 RepID=Q6AG44_LEIXX|nr:phosphonatase-like hydrolase [Leifsonia xyli]AAT88651.1 phosphonoacetaldehyde hydrolase [Leifsonia xyli subsp. xyli str. CTCB07]ODA90804.1 HAD family hydrolase [Leifsonia xyli subsp. xyli]
MTISLVSLDLAGTTIDEGGIVYDVLRQSVTEAVGAPVPAEVLDGWTGTDKREAVEGLLTALGADPAKTAAVHAAFAERLDAAYAAATPRLFPGVREAVASLRASGVKVGLHTGYERVVAERLLEKVEWAVGADVDALATSEDVAASRPAPYLVFRTMESTATRSVQEMLVAGDTPNDLRAGIASGARLVVGVLSGASSAETLGRHPHTHLLASVAALPELLAAAGELPR